MNWGPRQNEVREVLFLLISCHPLIEEIHGPIYKHKTMKWDETRETRLNCWNQYIECWECCSSSSSYSVTFLSHPRVRFVCVWDLDLFTVLFVYVIACIYVCMYVCMYFGVILVIFWCYFSVILVLFWCYFGVILVLF